MESNEDNENNHSNSNTANSSIPLITTNIVNRARQSISAARNAVAGQSLVIQWVEYYKNLFMKHRNALTYVCTGYLSLWLAAEHLHGFISNMIGFLYPAYQSIKAVETPEKDDDTEWLIYWVVFAIFSVGESFSDFLFFWFPFYYASKCLFLLWCMYPAAWNGSSFIYYSIIRVVFIRNQPRLDGALRQARSQAQEFAGRVASEMITARRGSS